MTDNQATKERKVVSPGYRPLIAILFFVILAGASGSQVVYSIKGLGNGFDLLSLIELLVFGFLLILSFLVLVAIVYSLDQSQGRIKNRSALIESFFGDPDE